MSHQPPIPSNQKHPQYPAIPASWTWEFVSGGGGKTGHSVFGLQAGTPTSNTRVSVERGKERSVCWPGWNCKLWLWGGVVPKQGGCVWGGEQFGDPQSDPRTRFRELVGSQVGLDRDPHWS